MSDEFDEVDDNTADDDAQNGPKALRDQVKKLQKKLDAIEAESKKDKQRLRSIDLQELLDAAKAPKRLAKYAARDIEDVNEDNVLAWLKENGEDFGWSPDEGDDEVDEAEVDRERVSRATARAPQRRPDTSGELLNLLRTGDTKTLIEKGFFDAD
jgi:hypothetical protein